jgi:hypothetical protein
MTTKLAFKLTAALLLLSTLNSQLSTVIAQGSAFTYQGRLNDGATPANGTYVFRFTAVDGPINGNSVGTPVVTPAVDVSNGLFTVTLDFGPGIFNGANRWLNIEVHTNQQNLNFTALTPPQPILPTPYAIYAAGANAAGITGVLPTAGLSGSYSNPLNLTNPNNTYAGNGGDLTNVNAARLGGLAASNFWQTAGNTGTTAGVNFLGTADNQPLEIKVNSQRVFRLSPDSYSPRIEAGHPGNVVSTLAAGGAVLSGGDATFPNRVDGSLSVVVGGSGNVNDGAWAAIGGGQWNDISAESFASTIAGGFGNDALGNAPYSTIGGGSQNSIGYFSSGWLMIAGTAYDTIAGGQANGIGENSFASTIGGGLFNKIGTNVRSALVSGGEHNMATNDMATVGGGYFNLAGGRGSTVAGGYSNTATNTWASVAGGNSNVAGGQDSTVAGGSGNKALGGQATVSGGIGNLINSPEASIGGGALNLIQASAAGSTIGGGHNNTIQTDTAYSTIGGGGVNMIQTNATYSTIGGGYFNLITDNVKGATIPGGLYASATSYGQQPYASGGFLQIPGSAQASLYVLRGLTANASVTELFLDGNESGSVSNRMNLPSSGLWAFDILVVAGRTDVKQDAGYQIKGIIGNVAGVTLVKGLNKTVLWEDDASWDVSVEADSTHQALVIKVTGGSGQTIRWVANVRTVEVIR